MADEAFGFLSKAGKILFVQPFCLDKSDCRLVKVVSLFARTSQCHCLFLDYKRVHIIGLTTFHRGWRREMVPESLFVVRIGRLSDHIQVLTRMLVLFQQHLLCVAAVALIEHVEARAQRLLEGDQVGADFVLEVVNLVNQVLLLLLLFVFVVIDALLESQLGLLEPCQRIWVAFHKAVETRIKEIMGQHAEVKTYSLRLK